MPKGRPRAFDIDQALERALQVFWRKGYEGTTLPDLTKALGINRPSLYAAFGNKEALFRKALDHYAQGPAGYVRKALAEPTARAVVEQLLQGAINSLTDPRNPPGCLNVQGALACGEESESIRQELISRRNAGEVALRHRFELARSEGDLPADSDPADLARYIVTLLHGMSVQATGGASREELLRVRDLALRALPESRNG
jgi:AcrR family transcriptional regulator